MNKVNSEKLLLKIDTNPESFEIEHFDGARGLLTRPWPTMPPDSVTQSRLFAADIRLTGSEQSLWSGNILFLSNDSNPLFSLLVTPTHENAASLSISWAEVPKVFSIFDGGYISMNPNEVGQLIDDLIEFRSLVRADFFFLDGLDTRRTLVHVTDQDQILKFSNFSLQVEASTKLPTLGTIGVASFELFEVTYFFIGLVQEIKDDQILFGLTVHIYREAKRVGRRIPIEPIVIGGTEIIEVSDFGMCARFGKGTAIPVGSIIDIEILENKKIPFVVAHCSSSNINTVELGLRVENCNSESRTIWQTFLLTHQYPALRLRTPSDHERTWKLLESTGYLKMGFGSAVTAARSKILKEWKTVDEKGPYWGAAVVAEKDNELVATIGVSRAGNDLWVAQTAAMVDHPTLLPITRSIYGWRTRFILQQSDGQYHLAFFQRDKPFLDRFFRKFFLLQGATNTEVLSWTEWKYYSQVQSNAEPTRKTPSAEIHSSNVENELLFNLLSSQQGPLTPTITHHNEAIVIRGRPHLHICQYFSSLWLSEKFISKDIETFRTLHPGTSFYSVRTKIENDQEQIGLLRELGQLDFAGWEVVWVCHRSLLPLFMGNSLRALELMLRKYGARSVA